MKKVIFLSGLVLLMLMPLIPVSALAASTLYIDITATGCEVDITCTQTSWSVGIVEANDEVSTAINWGRLTNNTSVAVSIRIYGNDMKDVATGTRTWTLGTSVGAAQFAMNIGVDDDDDTFDVAIKKYGDTPYNMLKYNTSTALNPGSYWDFGLQFLAPSSNLGNDAMIMCDINGDRTNDADNGLALVAEVAV